MMQNKANEMHNERNNLKEAIMMNKWTIFEKWAIFAGLIALFVISLHQVEAATARGYGFKSCANWDTFCKSPAQIVATKCRLGVPVFAESCELVGVKDPYTVKRASLVPGLPVSEINTGRDTNAIIGAELE